MRIKNYGQGPMKVISAIFSGKNDTYFVGLGNKQCGNKEYAQAIENYQKVVEFNPKNEEAYFGLGYCYNELSEYSTAISTYQKFAEFNPSNDTVYFNIAIL